jgi:hypothetical protein
MPGKHAVLRVFVPSYRLLCYISRFYSYFLCSQRFDLDLDWILEEPYNIKVVQIITRGLMLYPVWCR